MAECKKCGKTVYHLKYDRGADMPWKCEPCFYGYTGEEPLVSETKMGWEPYTLQDGPIESLPDNWPGKVWKDGKFQVDLKDRAHEKETMYAIGCHFGERGEKVGGHDLMLKGRSRIGNVVYSFSGRSRKASTCR